MELRWPLSVKSGLVCPLVHWVLSALAGTSRSAALFTRGTGLISESLIRPCSHSISYAAYLLNVDWFCTSKLEASCPRRALQLIKRALWRCVYPIPQTI